MTQEEYKSLKELLLKDLCARLPYGVIGKCEIDASYDTPFETKLQTHKFDAEVYGILEEGLLFVTPLIEDQDVQELANEEVSNGIDILDFKPYLFPLSSMTEEQKEELKQEHIKDEKLYVKCLTMTSKGDNSMRGKVIIHYAMDWCNKNHFDYRGLIEKGLAIDATELNIYC